MNYVRTKDGNILQRIKTQLRHNGKVDTWYGNRRFSILYDFEHHLIEKEADTIEELCDEFVVIGIFENQIGCCCDTFKEAKELKDYVELPKEQIIYGSIWTDKGLMYVAKMNDKGELELL